MSAERNTAREWRRALARQNALANEIAAACASGRVPDRRLVAEWSLASMRVYAREKNLRPRECGAPLGEGNQPAAPLRGVSSPVDRAPDAAPNPATLPTTQTQPTMKRHYTPDCPDMQHGFDIDDADPRILGVYVGGLAATARFSTPEDAAEADRLIGFLLGELAGCTIGDGSDSVAWEPGARPEGEPVARALVGAFAEARAETEARDE